MRTIALAAVFAAAGFVSPGWADDAKKDAPKATKIVAEGMT
jgi:hypothetical protein